MTPRQKAKELVDKYYNQLPLKQYVITTVGDLSFDYDNWKSAKQCALIAVNEILAQDVFGYTSDWSNTIEYWEDVKQEIKNL